MSKPGKTQMYQVHHITKALQLLSHDRCRRSGGVVIYIRNEIAHTVRNYIPGPAHIENIWIELSTERNSKYMECTYEALMLYQQYMITL